MAKAKSASQAKPAAAAKKNVKAKQAAVKAETKKVVPKKVSLLSKIVRERPAHKREHQAWRLCTGRDQQRRKVFK